MSGPAFDELLRRLADADVRFVVVGGLAVNAWGVVRGTKDVDVVVAPEIGNLKRLAEVAVAAGGHVQKEEALLGTPARLSPGRVLAWAGSCGVGEPQESPCDRRRHLPDAQIEEEQPRQ